MSFIVAGIGTEVGKTVVSAILCEAKNADYWKPVQAGELDYSDSDKVRDLVTHKPFNIHPETHRLKAPMSPHAAAALEGISITREDFERPNTQGRTLITELAGGLMVPFSSTYLMVDLVMDLGDPVVLVANSYLGSINHTLLSLDLIRQRGIDCAGIIFNGTTNPQSREVILSYSQAPLIADIPHSNTLDKAFVRTHADKIRNHPRLA